MVRVLGQLSPQATTQRTLYTVPTGARTQVATIYGCNQAGGSGTVRISVVTSSAGSVGAQSYLYYDKTVAANDTLIAENVTLGPGDSIGVYASSASFSFTAFGDELEDS